MDIKLEFPLRPRSKRAPTKWFLFGISTTAKKRPYTLCVGENRAGKSRSSDLWMPSSILSRFHCTLTTTQHEVFLTDHSKNGTYVNHVQYKSGQRALTDSDVIGFGIRTDKFDMDDQRAFVYRLQYIDNAETITLSDDEDNSFNMSCDSDSIEAQFSPTSECEKNDDEEDDDNASVNSNNNSKESIINEYDDFRPNLDFINFDEDITQSKASPKSWPKPQPPMLAKKDFMPVISIDKDILSNIKTEVAWYTHEYDKNKSNDDKSNPKEIETIDLCDDGDVDEITIVPAIEPQKRRHIDEFKFPEMVEKKRKTENQISKPKIVRPQVNYSETERDQLIKSITIDRGNLKAKVKISSRSRAQQLSLDLLGIVESPDFASTSTTINNPSMNSKLTWDLHDSSEVPSHLPVHMDVLVSEITSWDGKWLRDNYAEAPITDLEIIAKPIPLNFTSAKAYADTMIEFFKLELWHQILLQFHRKNYLRTIFTQLNDMKYIKRSMNRNRFVFFCEAETNETADSGIGEMALYVDNLVLVTHAHGRFLAFVSKINYRRLDDQKIKMEFQMEASKVKSNENMNELKHVSIKAIKNIRLDLEIADAVQKLDQSSLCQWIIQPTNNANTLFTNPNDVIGMNQEKIIKHGCHKLRRALNENKTALYLTDGGPATGKSTVILNVIQFLLRQEMMIKRIIFFGVNQESIDVMATTIAKNHENIVIFGSQEYDHEPLKSICLSSINPNAEEIDRLNSARLVFTKVVWAPALNKFSSNPFHLCIVDDASFVTEIDLMPAFLLNFHAMFLVGDQKCSATSVGNQICRERGFARSLFNRIIASHASNITTFLPSMHAQRRMHFEIQRWPNQQFYDHRLTNTSTTDDSFPFMPYTVFSFCQEHGEVGVVESIIETCFKSADPAKYTYGIIPGFLQSKHQLQKAKNIPKNVKIASMDCFIGCEFDIVIITAIKAHNFEYLSPAQMMAIALTRAKKCLFFCGNFSIVENFAVWKAFLNDAKDRKRFFQVEYGAFSTDILLKSISKDVN